MSAPLPFQISRDAERYIRDCLYPQPGKDAALVQTFNLEAWDKRGIVYMRFPGEFFTVSYVVPGERPSATHIDMFGTSVSIIPQTLQRLRECKLELKKHVYRYGWFRKHTACFLVAVNHSTATSPAMTSQCHAESTWRRFR